MTQNKVSLNNFNISNELPFTLIAGPCALESHDHAKLMVEKLLEITSKAKINFIYKTSYDKANRTSLNAERGMGLDASLRIFSDLKDEYDIPILTDVHSVNDCMSIKDCVDVIQIPAFLSRQTDLLIAAAKTMKIVNVKKGQFLSPYDMINVAKKILDTGNKNLLLTERGVSFGYNTLVSDMRSLEIMKNEIKFPVIFDATHSVQAPGGQGRSSGGDRQFVPVLSKAAVAVGVGGVFIETHENPDIAPSDGPNMVKIDNLYGLIMKLIEIDNVVKQS